MHHPQVKQTNDPNLSRGQALVNIDKAGGHISQVLNGDIRWRRGFDRCMLAFVGGPLSPPRIGDFHENEKVKRLKTPKSVWKTVMRKI